MKPRRYDNPIIDDQTGQQYNIYWHDDLSGPERAEAVRLFSSEAKPYNGVLMLLPPNDWKPSLVLADSSF